MLLKCRYCGKQIKTARGYEIHLKTHEVNPENERKFFENLIVKDKFDGVHPICKCGCGEQLSFSFKSLFRQRNYGFAFKKKGHSPRGKKKQKEKCLKHRKFLWPKNKPIDFPQTNHISNDPSDIFLNEKIVWKGIEIDYKFLKTITEEERDEIAKDLLNFFMQVDFGAIGFPEKVIEKDWETIKKKETKIIEEGGNKLVKNSGIAGSKLCRHFFPNITKIKGKKKISIFDALCDREILWKIIRNRIGNTVLIHPTKKPRQWPMTITPSQMITGAKNSGIAAMGSVFKPSVAKTIYDHWTKENDKVLDYSCGFGGRLIGAMSLQKNLQYYGYEPNEETFCGLQKLIDSFEFKAFIKKSGSEEELFDEKFDFIFSSPPYFDHEIYCEDQTQCYKKFSSYNDWLEKYWRKTIRNCKQMMKQDAVFAVNVGGKSNKKMQAISCDMRKIIKQEGFELIDEWSMKTSRSHLSSKKGTGKNFKLESLFFYRL